MGLAFCGLTFPTPLLEPAEYPVCTPEIATGAPTGCCPGSPSPEPRDAPMEGAGLGGPRVPSARRLGAWRAPCGKVGGGRGASAGTPVGAPIAAFPVAAPTAAGAREACTGGPSAPLSCPNTSGRNNRGDSNNTETEGPKKFSRRGRCPCALILDKRPCTGAQWKTVMWQLAG